MTYKRTVANGEVVEVSRYGWGKSDVKRLVRLFEKGIPLSEICFRLDRTMSSVQCKLTGLRNAGIVGRRRPSTKGARE